MTSYKYTLEKYKGTKTKHICPSCQKRTITRYIDNESKEYIHETVGRCDRESKCNYHLKPAEYFKDSGVKNVVFHASLASPASPKVYIPFEILQKSRLGYHKNSFVKHLNTLFDQETVNRLIAAYHIGTSDGRWAGACIFWFIDAQGRIHAGQVKLFENGHTAKHTIEDGESKSCTTYIHSILKRKLQPVPSWLAAYDQQERKVNCLFGEHLIKGSTKPFAIVEAPATAIVASVYLPMFTWLACGSLSYLNAQRCEPLKGKKVVLFPDLNGYGKWKLIADQLGFTCSNLLEDNASELDKSKGLDLRDYLEKFNIQDFIKQPEKKKVQPDYYIEYLNDGTAVLMHPSGSPASWDLSKPLKELVRKNPGVAELVEKFQLQIN